jgi:hypothetical protein
MQGHGFPRPCLSCFPSPSAPLFSEAPDSLLRAPKKTEENRRKRLTSWIAFVKSEYELVKRSKIVLNVRMALALMIEVCSRLKAFGGTGEERAPERSQD